VKRCEAEGRVPAVEVMINTAFIRECILVPEKTRSVRDAIAAGFPDCTGICSEGLR